MVIPMVSPLGRAGQRGPSRSWELKESGSRLRRSSRTGRRRMPTAQKEAEGVPVESKGRKHAAILQKGGTEGVGGREDT